jgi:NAD(P)-dependent dehydrogenase (short-subunit alcohol dehydrogenase family)
LSHKIFDLTNKTALCIGGAGGIGSESCLALSEAGANVIVADLNVQKAENLADTCRSNNVESMAVKVDVTQEQSIDVMFSSVFDKFSKIDILIYFVGYNNRQMISEFTKKEWEKTFEINMTGCFLVCKKMAERMKTTGGGKIVITTSVQGVIANPLYSAYAASKAAMIHFAKIAAQEWIADNIYVNTIAPTATETEFIQKFLKDNPGKREFFESNIPLGRIAKPADYIGPVLFLCSKASDFLVGHCLVLDGGESIH